MMMTRMMMMVVVVVVVDPGTIMENKRDKVGDDGVGINAHERWRTKMHKGSEDGMIQSGYLYLHKLF